MKTQAEITRVLQSAIRELLTNPSYALPNPTPTALTQYTITSTMVSTLNWVLHPGPQSQKPPPLHPPPTSVIPTPNYN